MLQESSEYDISFRRVVVTTKWFLFHFDNHFILFSILMPLASRLRRLLPHTCNDFFWFLWCFFF
uniref:Uncharacterized protein n=1 Tax=Octopus bimaculoides TaxID=37653 RepID=A0A0L8HJJ3_OCTBM